MTSRDESEDRAEGGDDDRQQTRMVEPVDWNTWKHMRLAPNLALAVLLTMNADPSNRLVDYDEFDHAFFFSDDGTYPTFDFKEANRRLMIFRDRGGDIGVESGKIVLADVAAVAIACGMHLPDEFPGRAPALQASGSWPWGEYSTPKLEIFKQVGLEFFGPGAPKKKPLAKNVAARFVELLDVNERQAQTYAAFFTLGQPSPPPRDRTGETSSGASAKAAAAVPARAKPKKR